MIWSNTWEKSIDVHFVHYVTLINVWTFQSVQLVAVARAVFSVVELCFRPRLTPPSPHTCAPVPSAPAAAPPRRAGGCTICISYAGKCRINCDPYVIMVKHAIFICLLEAWGGGDENVTQNRADVEMFLISELLQAKMVTFLVNWIYKNYTLSTISDQYNCL